MTPQDYIQKLKRQGKLEEFHVHASAKFEKLVYTGFSSESLKLERVDGSKSFGPNLSGIYLAKLPKHTSDVLTLVIIHRISLVNLGLRLGETSRTSAYRRGLEELRESLDVAYNILR